MSKSPEITYKHRHIGPCIERTIVPLYKAKETQPGLTRALFQINTLWHPGDKPLITITFGTYPGCTSCGTEQSWSYIGNETQSTEPAMNLGFIDPPVGPFEFNGKKYQAPAEPTGNEILRNYKDFTTSACPPGVSNTYEQNHDCYPSNWVPGGTTIHEFCHSLGMLHEHQNALGGSPPIKLDQQAVNQWYLAHGMTKEEAYANTIHVYTCQKDNKGCDYTGSTFDKYSIMLYWLPDSWIIGPNPTRPNFTLSPTDKLWLSKKYPLDDRNMPILTYKFVDISPSEWKIPWVIKDITENLMPFVGVKMHFINDNGTTLLTSSPTEFVTRQPSIGNIINNVISSQPAEYCGKKCKLSCTNNHCKVNCVQDCKEHFTMISNTVLGVGVAIIAIVVLILMYYYLVSKKGVKVLKKDKLK